MFSYLAKWVYHLIGWRLLGTYPDEIPKKIIIVAPHTSAWDVPIGLLVKIWLKMDVQYYVKQEMFKGILKYILPTTGAAPLDRSGNTNFVESVIADYNKVDRRTILITPEGTRKKVNKFRTGFYYIADGAKIPIIPISFNFEKKIIEIHPSFYTTGDAEKDIAQIENIYRGIPGCIREYSFGEIKAQ